MRALSDDFSFQDNESSFGRWFESVCVVLDLFIDGKIVICEKKSGMVVKVCAKQMISVDFYSKKKSGKIVGFIMYFRTHTFLFMNDDTSIIQKWVCKLKDMVDPSYNFSTHEAIVNLGKNGPFGEVVSQCLLCVDNCRIMLYYDLDKIKPRILCPYTEIKRAVLENNSNLVIERIAQKKLCFFSNKISQINGIIQVLKENGVRVE